MTEKSTGISTGDQATGTSRRLRTAFAALGMLPVLILLAAGFQFMNPRFLTETNLLIVTQQSSINIVLAAGMTFVIRAARRLYQAAALHRHAGFADSRARHCPPARAGHDGVQLGPAVRLHR
jgi:hypothetical protein